MQENKSNKQPYHQEKIAHIELENDIFKTEHGKTLSKIDIKYERWGNLNSEKSNAIILFHALTGSSHAASQYETKREEKSNENSLWFDKLIGPGCVFDTNEHCIICPNTPGSCYGSTGPESIDPQTGNRFGKLFPFLSTNDLSRILTLWMNQIGINKPHTVVGGSMGGMIVWEMIRNANIKTDRYIIIACENETSDWFIGFNHIQRLALTRDPDWDRAPQKGCPHRGVNEARQASMLCFRTDEEFHKRFNRSSSISSTAPFPPEDGIYFDIQSYLKHNGKRNESTFSPVSYFNLTWAVDYFSVKKEEIEKCLSRIHCISIDSDRAFPSKRMDNLINYLKSKGVKAYHHILSSIHGHDAFLIDLDGLEGLISRSLKI